MIYKASVDFTYKLAARSVESERNSGWNMYERVDEAPGRPPLPKTTEAIPGRLDLIVKAI